MSEYKSVRLKKTIIERIEKIMKSHPEYGYKSTDDFIEDAIVGNLKKIKKFLYLYTIVLVFTLCLITYLIVKNELI